MSFEVVQCEVHWRAVVNYLDSSGTQVIKRELIGDFEAELNANYAMADAGLTRDSWGNWRGSFCDGTVTRVLKEIK